VPRKFGKTTLVSGIAIYELLFGDADGQVYACANSYQQAKICFDNIRNCLKALDRTGNRFRVNREVIFNDMKGRSSFARCLASDPSTLDGLSASCYILDEYAQARSAELRNVMSTSTGVRHSPLEVIITTASDVLDGPCVGTLEAYQRILLDEAEDDSVFALIFIPDVDDNEADPRTWRKVQPHIGVTIQEDYYAEKWLKAQQSAEDMLAFRTKLLNIFAINESQAWITGDEIRDLYKPFSFESLKTTDSTPPFCAVSFDLSVWDDFSAVTYEIYRPNGTFHFHTDFYLPEGSIEKHPRAELYKEWVRKGYLNLLPGTTINYELIVQDIIRRNGQVCIVSIGYDPYHSKTAVNMLHAYGAGSVMHPVKQTYGAFTGAVETLELMVKEKTCTFTPNEITAWCFGNCQMDEDKNGNRKPIKRTHTEKIDGAITCLMCQDLFNNFKR
jgi:phage terminase large subunit-like protein